MSQFTQSSSWLLQDTRNKTAKSHCVYALQRDTAHTGWCGCVCAAAAAAGSCGEDSLALTGSANVPGRKLYSVRVATLLLPLLLLSTPSLLGERGRPRRARNCRSLTRDVILCSTESRALQRADCRFAGDSAPERAREPIGAREVSRPPASGGRSSYAREGENIVLLATRDASCPALWGFVFLSFFFCG